jgi:hypothetical protein
MTRSVYVIGGAGAGKSTFMSELLVRLGAQPGPLEDLHTARNARGNPVTLRGHFLGPDGLYIGCIRDSFPGTDGLDRASSLPGKEWLDAGHHKLLGWIVAEGATLATRPFLTALDRVTDLLLIHLWVDDMITDLRFLNRGSAQDDRFVRNTVTRAKNLLRDLDAEARSVDTADPVAWNLALAACLTHLKGT